MTISVGKSGAYKTVNSLWVGASGAWKSVRQGWVGAGGAWKLFYTAFTPVTHAYGAGSGSETIPSNASQVVITAKGAGSGGNYNNAGVAGDETITTLAISSSDWGGTLSYSAGAGGLGKTNTSRAPGGSSTITGTLASGSKSILAKGGLSGDTDAGYDTLNAGAGGAGGTQGFSADLIPGGNGGDGSISFVWT